MCSANIVCNKGGAWKSDKRVLIAAVSSFSIKESCDKLVAGADPEIEEGGGIHIKWGLVRRVRDQT